MPKRVGYLYEKMCDKERISRVIDFAARHKHNRHDVKKVLKNKQKYVDKLYNMLITHSYVPQTPRRKTIWDTSSLKERELEYVKFFPDGIIQVLIIDVMKPQLTKGMYKYCCASVPTRGGKAARKYVQSAIQSDPKNTSNIGKFDIYHYFHSVNIPILMKLLARKIKDKQFLDLISSILNTSRMGLPIGYYLSQWLSNYYLEWLDRFIISRPGVKYYVRYLDDIVIMGPEKAGLHQARKEISNYMEANLKIILKENWQIFPLSKRFVDFVGYKFYPTHTTLRKKNFLRYTRCCRRTYKKIHNHIPLTYHEIARVISQAGQLKHCDNYHALTNYLFHIRPYILKQIISSWSKECQKVSIYKKYLVI